MRDFIDCLKTSTGAKTYRHKIPTSRKKISNTKNSCAIDNRSPIIPVQSKFRAQEISYLCGKILNRFFYRSESLFNNPSLMNSAKQNLSLSEPFVLGCNNFVYPFTKVSGYIMIQMVNTLKTKTLSGTVYSPKNSCSKMKFQFL